jgi:hypothetical protein
LSPVRMAPASGASRSSDSKHLKSINRSDRITGVFLTPELACGKRAICAGGQIVFLREIFRLDHFPSSWQIRAWICFRVPSLSRMPPCR